MIIALVLIGLIVGASIGFAVAFFVLDNRINTLQSQINGQSGTGTYISYPNVTYFVGDNVSLSNLYQHVKSSVVVIQDLVPIISFFGQSYNEQQGSGFITSVNNQLVIVTNNHVIQDAINITVTFLTELASQLKF